MRALIIVDVQNDFLIKGSLEVPCGNDVIEPINQIIMNKKTLGLCLALSVLLATSCQKEDAAEQLPQETFQVTKSGEQVTSKIHTNKYIYVVQSLLNCINGQ